MTTRRGFLRMFAAAPIAGVAVGVAAKAEPTTTLSTPEGIPSHPHRAHTHSAGVHTHPISISLGFQGGPHACPYDGFSSLDHKHSFRGPDGRIWVLG